MIKISRIKMMKLVCGLFGLENLYGGDITSYIDIAKMAEDFGFDSISVTDHVVMGKNLHKYPFGNFPLPSDSNWHGGWIRVSCRGINWYPLHGPRFRIRGRASTW